MDYTLNIVSKCRFFFIFKHSRAPKKSWKIFHGPGKSWKSPGLFVSKRVGTLFLSFDLLFKTYNRRTTCTGWLIHRSHRITSCAGGRHNMPTPPESWPLTSEVVLPRAGSGVVRMDPIRFLAGCRVQGDETRASCLSYLSMFFIVLLFIRAPFYVLLVFIVCVLSFGCSS